MGNRFKDKGAVVTGAGRGIGRAVALTLAAEGAKVVVVDPGVARGGEGSDLAPADGVVAEIKKAGGQAVASYSSVTDFSAAEGIVKTCVETFGHVDILVNCAGILRERMVWNLSEEEWDSVIKVHLYGTFNCCRWAAGFMRQQRGGRIINFASDAWRGFAGQANYCAAKGAIVSLTRAMALELGRYGVTCNALSPVAGTRMTLDDAVIASFKKQFEAGFITKEAYEVAMNLPGPEYVAPLVAYLATDEAANINGKVFHVERGRVGIYSEPEEVRQVFNSGAVWKVEELIDLIPRTLLVGYVNPAPAEPPKEKTG